MLTTTGKIAVALVLVVLLIAGAVWGWQYVHRPQPAPTGPVANIGTDGKASTGQEPRVVYVEGQSTHTKEIVYVPKEKDDPTDVEVSRKGSYVYVKVNGVMHQVPVEVKEDAKFEKGKLVIAEQSEVKINITAPKQIMTLGAGYGTNGLAAQANGPLVGNVGWWVYGDRKTVAGGITIPINK